MDSSRAWLTVVADNNDEGEDDYNDDDGGDDDDDDDALRAGQPGHAAAHPPACEAFKYSCKCHNEQRME